MVGRLYVLYRRIVRMLNLLCLSGFFIVILLFFSIVKVEWKGFRNIYIVGFEELNYNFVSIMLFFEKRFLGGSLLMIKYKG